MLIYIIWKVKTHGVSVVAKIYITENGFYEFERRIKTIFNEM